MLAVDRSYQPRLLTVGGVVCFIVGAVAFYGSPGPYLPKVFVAWPIILTSAGLASLYGLVFVRTVLQIRNRPSRSAPEWSERWCS